MCSPTDKMTSGRVVYFLRDLGTLEDAPTTKMPPSAT